MCNSPLVREDGCWHFSRSCFLGGQESSEWMHLLTHYQERGRQSGYLYLGIGVGNLRRFLHDFPEVASGEETSSLSLPSLTLTGKRPAQPSTLQPDAIVTHSSTHNLEIEHIHT